MGNKIHQNGKSASLAAIVTAAKERGFSNTYGNPKGYGNCISFTNWSSVIEYDLATGEVIKEYVPKSWTKNPRFLMPIEAVPIRTGGIPMAGYSRRGVEIREGH